MFIVRGENVVYVGELDESREDQEESLVVDSSVSEANIKPFPKLLSGALLTDLQQQQNEIERNSDTGLPIIRRIPFEDAQKLHDSLTKKAMESHLKLSAAFPSEIFADTVELIQY